MIIEKDGKFFEIVETEREISEIEYLRAKVGELERRIASLEGGNWYIQWPTSETITFDHLYRPGIVTY